jgi:cysteine desulfurase family protein (TIGR01976 family)
MPDPRNSPSFALALDDLRANFPALGRLHNGQPVAYFDGPGGSQVPEVVGRAMLDYMYHHNANTHWSFASSRETDAMIEAAREAMADLLGGTAGEIAFGANMTTVTYHVSRSLGRQWGPGDEIVVTDLDHHANIDPWLTLEVERGLTVRRVRMMPETCQIDWQDLESKLGENTRLLALGAASNAVGTINDISRAAEIAHRNGALLYVDAVHYTPHRAVNIRDWQCDFLVCSAYKFYGPHVGILYGRRHLLEGLDVPKLLPAPDHAPDRLETGTKNHEGIAGAAAAVDFLASLGTGASRRERLENAFHALQSHEMHLFARLWDGLAALPRIILHGPGPLEPRTPTACFGVEGLDAGQVAESLGERGLFVSHGDYYATTALQRLGAGPSGFLRAGLACYSTESEVDRLISAIAELARG